MRHPTRQAIDKFNRLFNLEEEPHMQDWEIECADTNRIEEFIDAYKSETKSDDERFTLMALILGSYEAYHGFEGPDEKTWIKIQDILLEHREVHQTHIQYYQYLETDDEEEFFPITKLMRTI